MSIENKTVLILGGSLLQMPAVRIAKRKGWKILLADAREDVPAIPEVHAFRQVDLKDKEAMVEMAMEYNRSSPVCGVFTAGTDFSTTVAYVAEKMNLPGISYKTARKATDKSLMRAAFKEHRVASPEFVLVKAGEDPLAALKILSVPLVVKPVDNMGARGVRMVARQEDLPEAFKAAAACSRSGKVIIEEYMEGPEFSLDALVYKGEVTICGLADRHIFFPPYFVEMGHTMPTASEPEVREQIIEVFKRGIRALGIDNGAAKGDIKLTPRGAMVGEIAARLSGGFMSGWTYPYASGRQVTEGALNIAMGLPPGLPPKEEPFVSAERAFISIPGKVKEIQGEEKVKRIPGLMDYFPRVTAGSPVVFPINNVEKCGNIISRAPSRIEAVTIAEKGAREIFLRLEPANEATEAFLFHDRKHPRAFTLKAPGNLEALGKMPWYTGLFQAPPAILALPELEAETALDWHGTPFGQALEKIRQHITVSRDLLENHFMVGRLFWQAFLKGGLQGGLYLLDTLKKYRTEEGLFKRKLIEWIGSVHL